MKVLYVLRYYPTVSETFVYREIDAVVRAGHEVTIAALGSREDGRLQRELPRVPLLRPPRFSLPRRATAGSRWLAQHQRAKDARRVGWIARHAKRFDRIHVHFAGEAAEVAHALHLDLGIPYSVMVHAADLFQPRPSLETTLGGADAVLTVADHHVALLAERGIPAVRVRCGPDLDRLRPLPIGRGAVAVGRNVEKKGFADLVRVWPEIDLDLTLVSDWTGPVPPRVRVTGLLPSAGVRDAMETASVLVLPCRRAASGDMDGVPMVLMEAMALGRPVVTTRISGIPELVDDDVGWLVPPEEPVALVEALREATSRDECARRGARGPSRLRERGFTLADQAAGVLSAWGTARG
jgi:colanic acid/amylovoran biosynthesis glycosyltransferase